jgi:predicted dehydrogenase
MPGMDTIRWGAIGCGDVCEVKSGPGFQKAAWVPAGGGDAPGPRQGGGLRPAPRVPRFYADAEALIADPEVNAIYVATPPSTHMLYTKMAAAAGKPVYVEKPMARTHAECQEMIAACTAAGVPLLVAYYRRMLPRFRRVKEILDGGQIGTVRAVTVTLHQAPDPDCLDRSRLPWRVIPEIRGRRAVLDLASHTLDLLDHLLGPIAHARGQAAKPGRPLRRRGHVSAELRFASGVQGVGSWCFVAGAARDRVEIAGSRGLVSFATFADAPVVLETAAGSEEMRIPTRRTCSSR